MNNIIRICGYINRVNVGNPKDCFFEIQDGLSEINYYDTDLLVLPRLALCSPSVGSLSTNPALLNDAHDHLISFAKTLANHKGYSIIGLPVSDNSKTVSALALLNLGEIVAIIPCIENSPFFSSRYSDKFCDPTSVFSIGSCRLSFHTNSLDTLAQGAVRAHEKGCQLYVVPCYEPVYAGRINEIKEVLSTLSKSLNMAILVVNGGIGDTSSPYLYNGFTGLYKQGKQLAFESSFSDSAVIKTDIDLELFKSGGDIPTAVSAPYHSIEPITKQELIKDIATNPFLPESDFEKRKYLAELFAYQVQSLVARMQNTEIYKLVVGVSGGIDSTVALLVAVSACDFLELPRENVHGLTLPGLGTSETTYFNALALLEGLEVTRRDISIRSSVLQHFADISHTGDLDTTYENTQARERTQVLLDVGNMLGGLVVGSGDLSEEALGFSTFGGDHLASYNVNACVTKTVLKEIITLLAEDPFCQDISHILNDILDTPISPELLPPDSDGTISQQTESILGSYVLHEFFLYYFIVYNMAPSKLFRYASKAFRGVYNDYYIKEKLVLFITRFCSNQFKRSCSPDGASITKVNLMGVNYYIPSDIDPTIFLNELENNIS